MRLQIVENRRVTVVPWTGSPRTVPISPACRRHYEAAKATLPRAWDLPAFTRAPNIPPEGEKVMEVIW